MADSWQGRASRALALFRGGGVQAVVARMRDGPPVDIFDRYAFLLRQSAPPLAPPIGVATNTINWLLPAFAAGSGGHTNAFRFIRMLTERGYACRIVIDAGPWFGTADEIAAKLVRGFGPIDAPVFAGVAAAPPAFAAVATGWEQAHVVRLSMPAVERFYFVQDFEPWFFARGSSYGFAEQTYGFGFTGITAGRWLADKLRAEYGMTCHPVGFSYDKTLYRPRPRTADVGPRVFFYARPSTERRAFEMGMLALSRLCARTGATAVLAGFDTSRYAIPFAHQSLGVVDPGRLPDAFASCDLALVLSTTNLSLMPLELMACEIAVVSNDGPWVEWLLHPGIAMIVPAQIDALAEAMESLLADAPRRRALAAAGRAFAEETSWQREGDAMAAAFASRGCLPAPAGRASDRTDAP